MRFLKKSVILLAGLLAPMAASTPADAGVIPWAYDSVFGYGWGYGGWGYGAPYYGGYGGYGMGYGAYPVSYAPPVYQTNYAPAYGYADYSLSGGTYLADSCCCDPCSTGCGTGGCGTSECGTSVKSAKPEANPTPVDQKVVPKKAPEDQFGPTNSGPGANHRSNINSGVSAPAEEVLPGAENAPAERPDPNSVQPQNPDGLERPAPANDAPGKLNMIPRHESIAIRSVPTTARGPIPAPISVSRIAHIGRIARQPSVPAPAGKSQIAANP